MNGRQEVVRHVVTRQEPLRALPALKLDAGENGRFQHPNPSRPAARDALLRVAELGWQGAAGLVGAAVGLMAALGLVLLFATGIFLLVWPDLAAAGRDVLTEAGWRGFVGGSLLMCGLPYVPFVLLGLPLAAAYRARQPGSRYAVRRRIWRQLPADYQDDPALLIEQAVQAARAPREGVGVRLLYALGCLLLAAAMGGAVPAAIWLAYHIIAFLGDVTWRSASGLFLGAMFMLSAMSIVATGWNLLVSGQAAMRSFCQALLTGEPLKPALRAAHKRLWEVEP